MRIALAGNPNSGKTTMFNALTGKNEKVGNWAGVTVDKKFHPIRKKFNKTSEELIAVDLPGAYSISPFTAEESVTSDYIKNHTPDAIINIVDSTNLSRSLFFTTQLLELGIPVVVALNKSDINEKKHTKIDTSLLSEKLGCPVIETVSTSKNGLRELVSLVLKVKNDTQKAPFTPSAEDCPEEADRARFAFVNAIVKEAEIREAPSNKRNVQDKIDAVLTNKWVGLPIFAAVMFLVFQISQAWLGAWIAEGVEFSNGVAIPGLVTLIDAFGAWVDGLMETANPLLRSIVVDGIIGGVGAVVGFLPLVMVMYFLLALLEDCGYMARATVVLDPIFKKVGLSGKSVIPFIIGTGCAVPGVMACRTIKNERERKATAMLAPFMPCGAKLPVIALFSGTFFSKSAWVGTLMYFVGIFVILIAALLIKKITGSKKKSYFIMELPEYKLPSLWKAIVSMCQRGWSFIVKAGTVILVCNFVVHLMQSFSWSFQPVSSAEESMLAGIALPFAYIFAPVIGYVSWQLAAATLTGFIAKENVVGTLAVCFAITNLGDGASSAETALAFGTGSGAAMTAVAALAFLMLNLFSPPCFAAIGAMNAEIKDRKWFWSGIVLQLAVGYSLGFFTYFFGTIFTKGSFGPLWTSIAGWCVIAVIVAVISMLIIKNSKESKNNKGSVRIG